MFRFLYSASVRYATMAQLATPFISPTYAGSGLYKERKGGKDHSLVSRFQSAILPDYGTTKRKSMFSFSRLAGGILLTVLAGCGSLGGKEIVLEQNPNKTFAQRPAEPSFEWGIAISGGGLRSASYARGALKRLYDDGILQRVSILSTVSGGGYTGYELMMNELAFGEASQGFGSATFSPQKYIALLYQQYYTANFVTYGAMLKAALNPFETFPSMYQQKIINRYGYSEKGLSNGTSPVKMGDLAVPIAARRLPFLVVNTTLINPEPKWLNDDNYEFTPFYAGSQARGFNAYKTGRSPDVSKAVAISGASDKRLLKQTIEDPTQASEDLLTLSDGGHSENLGAFALLTRNVKNVIILDGEHDPKYEFGAYRKLKQKLAARNLCLEIASIEDLIASTNDAANERTKLTRGGRLNAPVMTGAVKKCDEVHGTASSRVIYLKMANSVSVDEALTTPGMVAKGEEAAKNARIILNQNKDSLGNWDSSKLPSNLDHKAILSHYLYTYPKTLGSIWKVKIVNLFGSEAATLDFPQYSTGDQSFYNDQIFAYIGLGYFSAAGIAKEIKNPEKGFSRRAQLHQ